MTTHSAHGVGLATRSPGSGKVLDTWFPVVGTDGDAAQALVEAFGVPGGNATVTVDRALLERVSARPAAEPHLRTLETLVTAAARPAPLGTERVAVVTVLEDLANDPRDAHDLYLRLHLLSHRLVAPHGASLEGAFGRLNNVVWTDLGPCEPERLAELRLASAAEGRPLRVSSVDKFPRMTDYVVPSGVRIADADRVRLGAHLAEGTTVMHEGFVNYNAGTLGASMIEGRISAGVVVGDGSDLGGSASTMGTLSGGGDQVISIGRRCLLGANAGIGISLGDDCVVEAGLYITAGTRVTLPDGAVVRARELSGHSGLLYRRDSESGRVVALPREGATGDWGGLNAALHVND